MQKTNSGPEAKALLDQEAALKKRAARQAQKRELAPTVHDKVLCTVLPQGHEKISMGQHIGALGEVHYEEDETFTVDLPIALALYKRGYVNFEGARDAQAAIAAEDARQARSDAAEKAHLDNLLGSVAQ